MEKDKNIANVVAFCVRNIALPCPKFETWAKNWLRGERDVDSTIGLATWADRYDNPQGIQGVRDVGAGKVAWAAVKILECERTAPQEAIDAWLGSAYNQCIAAYIVWRHAAIRAFVGNGTDAVNALPHGEITEIFEKEARMVFDAILKTDPWVPAI